VERRLILDRSPSALDHHVLYSKAPGNGSIVRLDLLCENLHCIVKDNLPRWLDCK
jgi:hypothetical protein